MKTFAFGILEADTDTWPLASDSVITSDENLLENFDSSLDHEKVSVVGTMGIPPSSLEIEFIVEKLASHDDIEIRAYDISAQKQKDPQLITGSVLNVNSLSFKY